MGHRLARRRRRRGPERRIRRGARERGAGVGRHGPGGGVRHPRRGGEQAHASEGGHADFAPRTDLESELREWMARDGGHVSYERVCSGMGLVNVYAFLRARSDDAEPDWLEKARAEHGGTAITRAGLDRRDPIASDALDVMVSIYGAQAGNVALTVMATGGVYLGGGIAPKILPRLKEGGFMRAFTAKGRLTDVLGRIPVMVILNELTACSARRATPRCAPAELLRLDERHQLGATGRELGPAAVEFERRERSGRELLPHPVELVAADRELERQPLHARVVADHHHRLDLVGHLVERAEQLARGCGVELVLDPHLRAVPRGRAARASRACVSTASTARAPARCPRPAGTSPSTSRLARREAQGPVAIGEPGLVPTRLRVPQQVEPLHDPHHGATLIAMGASRAQIMIGAYSAPMHVIPFIYYKIRRPDRVAEGGVRVRGARRPQERRRDDRARELRLGSGMISGAPQSYNMKSVGELGGSNQGNYVVIEDTDAHYERAKAEEPRSSRSRTTRTTARAITRPRPRGQRLGVRHLRPVCTSEEAPRGGASLALGDEAASR